MLAGFHVLRPSDVRNAKTVLLPIVLCGNTDSVFRLDERIIHGYDLDIAMLNTVSDVVVSAFCFCAA